MNREILFRGKRVDNGEWVEGNLTINEAAKAHRIVVGFGLTGDMEGECHVCFGEFHLVDPSTIGQYVGLLDKNGVKIFERMELRVKHAMSDEDGCFVDAIYRVDKLTYEGLRLSFVRLFSDTPDARSNSYPICQTLSFNHGSLTTDYRNSNYDRVAVNETRGENSLSQSQWKENHYSNDIEVFEYLTKQ